MLGAMVLMLTVLRSPAGVLVIVGGLWVVALARARAARTSVAAREFLIDLLAMALVLVVPLVSASPTPRTTMAAGMPGMFALTLGAPGAVVVLGGWLVARLRLLFSTQTADERARSLVSGSCCALGLIAMLLI